MGRSKDLAKNTAILAFGKICTQSISFFMLPLYTSLLSTAEYGLFDLLVTYAALLLPLVNWQLDQGLFRFMLDVRGQIDKQTYLFSTVFLTSMIQSVVFCILFFIIYPFLTLEHADFLLYYVILHIYTAMFLQFARGLGKTSKYAVASFISALATVILNVLALAILKLGLRGLFIATISAQVLTIFYLIMVTKCWRFFSIKAVKLELFNEVRKYSIPLIPNNLAWWIVNSSDRMVISHFIGISANGIFTVASKFSNVFISFYNVVNLSWTESVSLHFDDEDRDCFLSEMMTTLFKLFASACFFVVAVMPFIFPILVNEKYIDGYNHVLILMYAMLFRVLVGMYSCIYIATKQSNKVAITSISAAVINLAVDLLCINKIGLYAASVSSLVAFLTMFIIRYFDVNRMVRMKIKRQVAVSSILIGALLPLAYYSNHKIVQIAALIITILYAVFVNMDLIKIVLKKLKYCR